jgi:hypothetical protein
MDEITIKLKCYKEDGWTVDMRCGDGQWQIYDMGIPRPETALHHCILELAKMRAHFESGATDYLAETHMGFKDTLKSLSFENYFDMLLNEPKEDKQDA